MKFDLGTEKYDEEAQVEAIMKGFRNLNGWDNTSTEGVTKRLTVLGRQMGKTAITFTSFKAEIKTLRKSQWQIRYGESIFEWGVRLQETGAINNPDVRWEYQRAFWLWLPRKIYKLVRKVL